MFDCTVWELFVVCFVGVLFRYSIFVFIGEEVEFGLICFLGIFSVLVEG